MRKVVKIAFICAILLFCNITVADAATKEELIAYVTKNFYVNGKAVSMREDQKPEITRLIREANITEAQADEIIAKVDAGVQVMRDANITDPRKLPADKKSELTSLGQQAAAIAGYDATPKSDGTFDVFKDGVKVANLNPAPNRPATQGGNAADYSYIVYAIAGVAVIAIAGFVVYTKKAKVNA